MTVYKGYLVEGLHPGIFGQPKAELDERLVLDRAVYRRAGGMAFDRVDRMTNEELARGRPVCVPPMDYAANYCWLGFGTVKQCPNQCKGECGYRPIEDAEIPPYVRLAR